MKKIILLATGIVLFSCSNDELIFDLTGNFLRLDD